ncbi:OsmC family protein [Maritimibacter sp. HL-12]|uniref:OsmC family protein n=1 Tax=Maritimibacter sp. HL-12 TaxID=1162418 RepID=UPI000A0F311F|nr:OsmC family protein [Maritimibacter sp. HL-12]SMH56254.1 Uncharacterized OsmC-related protein [Maritimibacter sp. HL-12]
MAPSFKPKRFAPVFVFDDGAGGTTFATSEAGERHSHPPNDKPVLTLLAAVSQCLLISLRMVAKREGVTLPAFHVSAGGEKAIDSPGRLQSIDCVICGDLADDAAEARRMVAQAKEICTVSNTLDCAIKLEWRRA